MKKPLFALVFCVFFHFSTAQDLLSQKKTDRLYKSGIDLLERNEYGAARQVFEDFLKLSPQQDLRRADAESLQALHANPIVASVESRTPSLEEIFVGYLRGPDQIPTEPVRAVQHVDSRRAP